MLIICCFAITVMVDTISSASSWSSLKFPPAIGTVHHALLHHLDSYSDHAMLFPAQVWGGIHENFISTSLVHCIYMCVHAYLFSGLVSIFNQFQSICLVEFPADSHPYDTICHDTTRHDTFAHLIQFEQSSSSTSCSFSTF